MRKFQFEECELHEMRVDIMRGKVLHPDLVMDLVEFVSDHAESAREHDDADDDELKELENDLEQLEAQHATVTAERDRLVEHRVKLRVKLRALINALPRCTRCLKEAASWQGVLGGNLYCRDCASEVGVKGVFSIGIAPPGGDVVQIVWAEALAEALAVLDEVTPERKPVDNMAAAIDLLDRRNIQPGEGDHA